MAGGRFRESPPRMGNERGEYRKGKQGEDHIQISKQGPQMGKSSRETRFRKVYSRVQGGEPPEQSDGSDRGGGRSTRRTTAIGGGAERPREQKTTQG